MPPKKAANGYKLPKPLTKGEVLTDTMKKRWIVGPVIGRGGFGEIYCGKLLCSYLYIFFFIIMNQNLLII